MMMIPLLVHSGVAGTAPLWKQASRQEVLLLLLNTGRVAVFVHCSVVRIDRSFHTPRNI